MAEDQNNNKKIQMHGWSRRQFMTYSLQLSMFGQAWLKLTEAQAKPTYNIGFWRQNISTTTMVVSEVYACVAARVTGDGAMAVSEIYASVVTLLVGDGNIAVSENYASVAANTPTKQVSEVFVAVVGKP